MADKVDLRAEQAFMQCVGENLIEQQLMLNWCQCCQLPLSKPTYLCRLPTPFNSVSPRPPFIFIQLLPCWGASSRPVGVERPICEFILLCRRAVNTHFCGCQLGEGGQPCGTQRRISSVPSSGNRAGFKEKPFFCSLFSPPREQHYCF